MCLPVWGRVSVAGVQVTRLVIFFFPYDLEDRNLLK